MSYHQSCNTPRAHLPLNMSLLIISKSLGSYGFGTHCYCCYTRHRIHYYSRCFSASLPSKSLELEFPYPHHFRVTVNKLEAIRPFFEAAAVVAQDATCHRAKCGTVIVQQGEVIGSGYNGPPLGDETNRMCKKIDELDLSIKSKYNKTCCPHTEVRAIFDALKNHADKIGGSTLYFMRTRHNILVPSNGGLFI